MASSIAINAHLLSGEASYRSAGIHGYIFNTIRHLPQAAGEFDLHLYLSGGQPPELSAFTVHRSRLSTGRAPVRILWEQAAAPLILRAQQPDLYHGTGFALPLAWRGPAIVTIYDLSFLRYPERLTRARRAYLSRIVPISARKATRILTISESSKREIVDLLGVNDEHIDVALPGVNSNEYRPLPDEQVKTFREAHQLPDRFILYVGTVEPRKNLQTLLSAYADLPERDDVALAIVGARGWQSSPIYAQIEALNRTNRILLPGYVSNEELPLWYNAAEIVAYPSLYEGFGLPPLEALACGTPVVVSDTSALPEAVGEAGVLLPPTDPTAWRHTLSELLCDPARRAALAARGPEHASQFTWEATAARTAESYRRALSIG